MKKRALLLILCLVFAITAIVPALAADEQSQTVSTEAVQFTDVTDVQKINVGDTKKLCVSGWNYKVTWKSSDAAIVSVSAKGVVRGASPGDATITATAIRIWDAWGKKHPVETEFKIKVTEKTDIPIVEEKQIMVGESITLQMTTKNKRVVWESSDKNIATVSRKGVVVGVSPGTVTVTAKSYFAWNLLHKKTPVVTEFTVVVVPKTEIFTVAFETNGGSEVSSQSIESGKLAAKPTDPTKEGNIFAGWYADEYYTEYFEFDKIIANDITLFARWLNIEDKTDEDNDSISDSLEDFLGTDKAKYDTDDDGLSDYVEISDLSLDPLKIDTNDDGVVDGNEDNDSDGLTNLEEINHGTNPVIADTDADKLNDFDEINIYNTNALKEDTDDDGVSDGKEIELGTDPSVAQESFELKVNSTESDSVKASVEITLAGEQVETLKVNSTKNEALFAEDIPGYLGKAYDFSVEGSFSSATINFEFDSSLLSTEDFEPVIYYFNEKSQALDDLQTVVTGNVASAEVTHFSTYVLLNRNAYQNSFKWIDVWDDNDYVGVEVVFIIDDSGSMKSNDKLNSRLTVAQNLIDSLPNNSRIGIVKFENSTEILTERLVSDREIAKTYLTTNYFISSGSTYMYNAITDAFSLFESEDDNILKTMIVLSDGDTSDTSKHSSVIKTANEKCVKIFSVGLGNSDSYFKQYLEPLALNTGGRFYLASNAAELSEIYNDIGKRIDIETDSDGDGISDYYEDNMIIFNGTKLLLDKNNSDSDGDGLLDGEEIELAYKYNSDNTKVIVTGIMKSNPTKIDSDGDGLYDNANREAKGRRVAPLDPEPLKYNGSIGMWNKHVLQQNDTEILIPTKYSNNKGFKLAEYLPKYVADLMVGFLIKLDEPCNNYEDILRPAALVIKYFCRTEWHTEVGAYFLNFIYDEYETAYHSQPKTWQRNFGYNRFYDDIFRVGTKMETSKAIEFECNDGTYALWFWKGDYWNLHSGAEHGLYKFRGVDADTGIRLFDAIDFEVPMTLSLYNYYSCNNIDHVFSWVPEDAQWWITGFNAEYKNPDSSNMISIGTIDFKDQPDLFNKLKTSMSIDNQQLAEYFIFDNDGHTVWIQWNQAAKKA